MLGRILLAATLLLAAGACATGESAGPDDPDGAGSVPTEPAADAVDTELAELTELLQPRFGEVNTEQLRRMVDPPGGDGPFFMVNLIEYRDHADYADGRATDLTGAEADQLYNEVWLAEAATIGAKPVFAAAVERDMLAEQQGREPEWDLVAIAWYPSRAEFLELIQRDSFRAGAAHKEAAVERSLVLVTDRLGVAESLGGDAAAGVDVAALLARPDPATTTHPATTEDRPMVMAHLIDFRDHAAYADGRGTDLTGQEAVQAYSANAGQVAFPMGVRPIAAFAVEGELIGDGRAWEEFRINWFPSHATFEALTSDPTWAQGYPHREAGIADTYALMTAPVLEDLEPEGT